MCDAYAEGSSLQIRENAAERLGEMAILSPEFCQSILTQVQCSITDAFDCGMISDVMRHCVCSYVRCSSTPSGTFESPHPSVLASLRAVCVTTHWRTYLLKYLVREQLHMCWCVDCVPERGCAWVQLAAAMEQRQRWDLPRLMFAR